MHPTTALSAGSDPGPTTTSRLTLRDGVPVLEKRRPDSERELATYERCWLTVTARHPTPPLVPGPVEGDDGATLVITRYLGPHTLASSPPSTIQLPLLMSSLCRLVASLHRDRIVHGNLSADHVLSLRRADGLPHPVLCSPRPSDDRRADLVGLAGVARQLQELGSLVELGEPAGKSAIREPSERWLDLVDQLDQDRMLSAERAAKAFERLARSEPEAGRFSRWLKGSRPGQGR